MGVLPQASFRLTTVGRGSNPSNGSRPSTPPGAAAASAPCHGVSRQYDTAMLGTSRCVGAAYLECCHSAPAVLLAAG